MKLKHNILMLKIEPQTLDFCVVLVAIVLIKFNLLGRNGVINGNCRYKYMFIMMGDIPC